MAGSTPPPPRPPIWRLHTKLYKGPWNVSANNSKTVGHKDLRFGQIVYILVLFITFHFFGFSTGRFPIFFLCLVYCVTVKTKNTMCLNKTKNKLKIGKNYWYFVDIFNKIIISLAPVGYEMAIYHLISNAKISNTHPWNNFLNHQLLLTKFERILPFWTDD